MKINFSSFFKAILLVKYGTSTAHMGVGGSQQINIRQTKRKKAFSKHHIISQIQMYITIYEFFNEK